MNSEDRAAGREESRRAQEELREAKKLATIPGFITLTLETDTQTSIALSAIAQIRPNNGTRTKTLVTFIGGQAVGITVKETHEEIMSLIHQAQHPAY